MKISIPIVGFILAGLLSPPTLDAAARPSKPRRHVHSASAPNHRPPEAYRAFVPEPFRTVQPTDVGTGALAPNGYRGPGSAGGGPAGGLSTGGP